MRAIIKFTRQNSDDLWHVVAPVILATVMAGTSFSGASVFLIAWFAVRSLTNG